MRSIVPRDQMVKAATETSATTVTTQPMMISVFIISKYMPDLSDKCNIYYNRLPVQIGVPQTNI